MTATVHFNLYMLLKAARVVSRLPAPTYDELAAKLQRQPEVAKQVFEGLRLMDTISKTLKGMNLSEHAQAIEGALFGVNLVSVSTETKYSNEDKAGVDSSEEQSDRP